MTASHARLERRLLARIRRLNRAFHLLEPGDHVLVACSGGKDSWALLFLLRAYRRHLPFSFELTAVTVDQGHPGFDAGALADAFAAHGFAHRIVFQDTLSVVRAKIPEGATTCPLCSRLRRGILYRVAGEIGATKIALGHHADDAIETLLMNQFFAGQIKAMPPRLVSDDGRHVVIRPLAWAFEREVAAYAAGLAVPIVPCDLCGSQPDHRRTFVRRLLDELERDAPSIRRSLLASLAHPVPTHLHLPAGGDEPPARAAQPTAPEVPDVATEAVVPRPPPGPADPAPRRP